MAEQITPANPRTYRAMQAVVIILGALIVAALGALVAGVALRAGKPPVSAEAAAAAAHKAPFFNDLHLADRSDIIDAQIEGDKLLVRVKNAYGQQVIILNANDGSEIGRVGIALQYNDSP